MRGMSVRIRNQLSSLFAWHKLSRADAQIEGSIGKLSSGLNLRSAADNVAGLGMAQRLRAQFTGLARATQNALDGLSLVQTTESALREVSDMLQRGRQLSLQAATGTLDVSQRQHLQTEVDHILTEINRISETATFNNRRILNPTGNAEAFAATLKGLKSGWLEESAKIIANYYGLTGDDSTVTLVLQNSGQASSWITGTPGVDGKLEDIRIFYNVNGLVAEADPDRKVARTLTQVMLARNSNYINLDPWFISGASDLIAGGNEMLRAATNANTAAFIVNAIDTPWKDDQLHQASAYLAMKYLDSQLAMNGSSMADVMSFLSWGNDLNTALSFTIGIDTLSFINEFKTQGEAFLNGLISSGTLAGSDVGGIHSGNSGAVIPDGGTYSNNPNIGFNLQWISPKIYETEMTLQVGANASDRLTFALPVVSTSALDLVGIDLVSSPETAITRFSQAISAVTSSRAVLGSVSNRLDHMINANQVIAQSEQASFSRIVDADMAREVTTLARNQILVSSSGAVLAQANAIRQNVSWLLNGLSQSKNTPAPATKTTVL